MAIKLSPDNPTERQFIRVMSGFFRLQKKRIVAATDDRGHIAADFWDKEVTELQNIMRPVLIQAFLDGADWTLTEITTGRKADPVGDLHQAVLDWIEGYNYGLVKGITDTTRSVIERALAPFYSEPGTRSMDVVNAIAKNPAFSPARAEAIAVTETTRAYMEGGRAQADQIAQGGIQMEPVWRTNEDDLVCSICEPRDGRVQGDGWDEIGPAHPRCRCWITYRVARPQKALVIDVLKEVGLLEQSWQPA